MALSKKKNKAGLTKIGLIASRLRLPKYAIQEAKMIFKLAVERDLTIGRDTNAITYACIYASCKIGNIPKTPLEVVAFTGTNKIKMLRAYKMLKKKLNLKTTPIDPQDLVHRFASKLHLKAKTISIVIDILNEIKGKRILQGRYPETIVASALYLSTKLNNDYRTQREIANVAGVMEVTIRKRSKEIAKALDIESFFV